MATILIADDQPANRQFLSTLLGYAGHQVIEAANGAEALKRVRQDTPQLVITDILMPVMDGYQFLLALRADSDSDCAATPVIFISATFLESDARELARACGVADFLAKPVEPKAVLTAVDAALQVPVAPPARKGNLDPQVVGTHMRLMANKLHEKVIELEAMNKSLDQRAAERESAENELRASQRELREFAEVSQSAREQEKARIARELHDELAQSLTALKIDLAWITERLPRGESAIVTKLESMRAMVDATVAAAGRIAADLRPAMLDELGLAAAVEWLVDNLRGRTAIECELEVAGQGLDLQEPLASCVFRVLQESLTNVARHSRASLVRVALRREGGEVALTVTDNGRGFAADVPRKHGSYGLMGVRERVYLVGGTVRIESAPGRGTAIDARFPLAPVRTA